MQRALNIFNILLHFFFFFMREVWQDGMQQSSHERWNFYKLLTSNYTLHIVLMCGNRCMRDYLYYIANFNPFWASIAIILLLYSFIVILQVHVLPTRAIMMVRVIIAVAQAMNVHVPLDILELGVNQVTQLKLRIYFCEWNDTNPMHVCWEFDLMEKHQNLVQVHFTSMW